VAANGDLADLALGHLVAVVIDHLHLNPPNRRPDRARLAIAVGMVERRHGRGLRQPVALEDDAAERRLERAQDLHGQRRAARDAQPQRGDVEALAVGMVQQRRVHRRHAREHRCPAALDQLEALSSVEARCQREAGPVGDRRVERARLAERVKQR
jgi:hypothetical protein